MRNYFGLLILSLAVFISCNDDTTTYTVGEDFIDLESRVIVTDTISIKSSTILIDSVETSSTNVLLIGEIQDSDFGNLTAQSFMNLLASDYDIDRDAVYDSIGIILYYNRYYQGDTTQVQTYEIHEIIENFEPSNDDDASFYNTSSLNYSNDVLGEVNFTPYPNKKDSIYIPLILDFGNSLFEKIQENDINNSDDLDQIFKGVTIKSVGNNNTILGFDKTRMVMRIYYTIDTENNEDSEHFNDFKINDINKFFNKITNDKSSTLLASLNNSGDNLETSETNNQAYIQAGSTLYMRLEIPHIKTFNALEQNGTAISAHLKFYPNIESYEKNTIGADSLAIFIADHKNRFISQLTGLDGAAMYAKIATQNDEFNSSFYYTADISAFFKEIQTSEIDLNYSLLFQFPSNNTTVNKIKIYDTTQSDKKMKIDLTYLLY
jgi:uncharacterized protein DUF4270